MLPRISQNIAKIFAVSLILMSSLSQASGNTLHPLSQLVLPPGFHIKVYAKVPGARSLSLGKNGVVFVGSRQANKVYAVIPNSSFTRAKKVVVIARGLQWPNGVSYHLGHLYVAEVSRILRLDKVDSLNPDLIKTVILRDDLPRNLHHGWRYLRVSPKGKLIVAIGAPCNLCVSQDSRFNTIDSMNLDGSDFTIIATGVRNSVGFDWNPVDHTMWFTDNGRDWLGDNLPPDELNRLSKQNGFFGYPYFYGKGKVDPYYKNEVKHSKQLQHLGKSMIKPMALLPAHVAPLGLRFYTGHQFPHRYKNTLFIAEHGSWNRSQKVGYQVIQVILQKHHKPLVKSFVFGWLKGQSAWGRPVDCLVMPDGSLLISDDAAGLLYRVSYNS